MITLNAIFNDNVAAATGTATQQFASIVKKNLCKPVCSRQSVQPTPSVTYSIVESTTVGTTTYVRIKAQGTITYVPKNACNCNTITQAFEEETTLIFSNASATNPTPAVALVQGGTDGYLTDFNCLTAKGYEMATLITVTATWS